MQYLNVIIYTKIIFSFPKMKQNASLCLSVCCCPVTLHLCDVTVFPDLCYKFGENNVDVTDRNDGQKCKNKTIFPQTHFYMSHYHSLLIYCIWRMCMRSFVYCGYYLPLYYC